MGAWVPSRFTKDVDVAVLADSDATAERVLQTFLRRGWHLDIILEQTVLDRLATARLVDPDGTRVDLLFASTGIECDVVEASVRVEVEGHGTLPVARPGHLVAMKLLSVSERRYKDAQDLVELLSILDEDELARAREAIARMDALGTSRGKDLAADLDRRLAIARG